MPKLPDGVKSTFQHFNAPVIMGVMGMFNYRKRVAEGENSMVAGAKELGMFAQQLLLSPTSMNIMMFGLPVARIAAGMVTDKVHSANNQIRQVRTPFSQRFEHSEMTMAAQMQGLQSIGASMQGAQMGAEAALMARRYGRGG